MRKTKLFQIVRVFEIEAVNQEEAAQIIRDCENQEDYFVEEWWRKPKTGRTILQLKK